MYVTMLRETNGDGEQGNGEHITESPAAEGDSEDGEGARRRNGSGREERMRAFLAQSVAHRLEGVNKAVMQHVC